MKPPLGPPGHGQCRHCRAWAEWHAPQCPICGISAPHSWLRRLAHRAGGWEAIGGTVGMAMGIAGGILSGAALGNVWSGAHHPPSVAALIFVSVLGAVAGTLLDRKHGPAPGALAGLTLGILAGGALMRWLAASAVAMVAAAVLVVAGFAAGKRLGVLFGQKVADGRRPRNLLECRDLAEARQLELEHELTKIADLRMRLHSDVPPAKAAPMLQALAAAAEATQRQLERHRVDSWRMTLGIWQNRLAPAMAGLQRAAEAETTAELARVDKAREELHQLIGSWSAHPSADSDRAQRVLAHAARLAEGADHLRQALLMRQAFALAGRSPGAAEAFGLHTVPEREVDLDRDPSLEVLRIRLTVDEAQTALEARDEALRLRAEQAAIAEVEGLLEGAARPARGGWRRAS